MTTQTTSQTPSKKHLTIRLTGPDGSTLSIEAHANKTGQARSFVRLLSPKNANGQRTASRGLSAAHPSMTEAQQAVEAHWATATKQGWTLPVKRSTGVDAFTAIPSAPKPAPPTKK